MIKNIRHTGIVVNDLKSSLWFYRDLLGFRVEKQMEEAGDYLDTVLGIHDVAVTTIKMSAPDGGMIELLCFKTHTGRQTAGGAIDVGVSHMAFTVADVDAVYDTLRKDGVLFISPPVNSPDGYARLAFCRAPEGTLIELVEVRHAT